jgi:yecA family protein
MKDEMSIANELPDYDELNEALARLEIVTDAAECHGMLCGLICADKQARKQWLAEILPGERESGDLLIKELRTMLEAVYASTRQQFDAAEFGVRLLLPDDNEALPVRLRALGQWCEGFYLGLGIAGINDLDKLPEDSREIVQDMIDIAQIEVSEDEANEEDEVAYAEVAEYLRVGVLLIHEELSTPAQVTQH